MESLSGPEYYRGTARSVTTFNGPNRSFASSQVTFCTGKHELITFDEGERILFGPGCNAISEFGRHLGRVGSNCLELVQLPEVAW